MKLGKTHCTLAAALTFGLGGCSVLDGPEYTKPSKEKYDNRCAEIFPDAGGELYVCDEDGDGKVDSIAIVGVAKFVAEGYNGKQRVTDETLVMTPEMQEAANKELKADQKLSYHVHQALYEAQENKK